MARFSGGIGWPTVVLCFGLTAVAVTSVLLALSGAVPLSSAAVVNSVVVYAFYTVHHDATHKSISGRLPRWRWLDPLCGTIAAVALQLDFRGYAGSHLRHHAFTNQPEDPDIVVKGPFWQLPLKWLLVVVLGTIAALPFGDRLVSGLEARLSPEVPTDERRRADSRRVRRWQQACLLVIVASIPFGAFWPMFWLWWVPTQVGILLLIILFQWLPHVPFDRTDRFGATRVTRFFASTWLLLAQDHHLIHHLYPSVPWYRYRAVFRELRPYLEQQGAIIEGRGTDPHVPIRLRMPAHEPGLEHA